MTTPGGAAETTVFSAAGHPFTWVEVIDAARVRGEWQALQRQVAGLLSQVAQRRRAQRMADPLRHHRA
ncbi:hypothetical protein FZI93_18540 [Mycobacterium sp. CBMA361]|nr:hypothetical protein [Mycolicibacterium sp. CBMA 361]